MSTTKGTQEPTEDATVVADTTKGFADEERAAMKERAQELKAASRADGKKADDLLADAMVALPLDPQPDILLWSKKLGGPIQDNSIEGMFWNIDKWGLAG